LSLYLRQSGTAITGRYIAATNGMCGKADLEGEIDGDKLRWHVSYIDCGDIEKDFVGIVARITDGLEIRGRTFPTRTPAPGSWAGFESVSGRQTAP
jgi:hypothetical protein